MPAAGRVMALSMERALSDSGQWRASITYQSRCLDHTSNGVGLHGKAASSRVAHSLNLPVDNPLVWWRSRTLLRLLAMLFGAVVLFAILAAILAFFVVAGMLELYEPVDRCSGMRDAMRDKWVLAVRTPDANVLTRAREAANKLRPLAVEEIPP